MKKQILYVVLALSFPALSSCDSWLDVSPKTEVKVSENFTSETGFKEALTGVYILMKSTSSYGRELTYGVTDVLAQQWGSLSSTNNHYYFGQYNYTATDSEKLISTIWGAAYNVIANVNVLIEHVDQASESLFMANNRAIIRGEAYGLRAMFHFDMLRLFAPSPAKDENSIGIPYVTNYGKDTTGFSTVKVCLDKILADLAIAEKELKIDPVYEQREATDDDESYLQDRGFKLNYYAIKALQARVYLYKRDYVKALAAAKEVIEQSYFTWTPSSEITTTDENARNRVFSEELLFGLYTTELATNYESDFTLIFLKSDYYWGTLFETSKTGYSGDYRYAYLTYYDQGKYARYSTKLKQISGNTLMSKYGNTVPLIRLSEAYYIAAEAALEISGEVADGVDYLNTVRTRRNIPSELESTITADQLRQEIAKEYAKEFIAEGQLFFYYKRTDKQTIPNSSLFTPDAYVLPLPTDEISNR